MLATEREVIEQDLSAALGYFKNDDFESLNIIANRVMSNLALVDSEEKSLISVGFLLKELAISLLNLRERKSAALETVKSLVKDFVERLKNEVSKSETVNVARLWADYHDLRQRLRKHELPEVEAASYAENHRFSHKFFDRAIGYLDKERHVLLEANNLFLKGLLNELGRVFHAHGGCLRETVALGLITALDRYYEYLYFEAMSAEKPALESMKEELYPYIDGVVSAVADMGEGSIRWDEVDKILWPLIYKWRVYFVRYMDIVRLRREDRLRLPEKARERLMEVIAKSIERELETKK